MRIDRDETATRTLREPTSTPPRLLSKGRDKRGRSAETRTGTARMISRTRCPGAGETKRGLYRRIAFVSCRELFKQKLARLMSNKNRATIAQQFHGLQPTHRLPITQHNATWAWLA